MLTSGGYVSLDFLTEFKHKQPLLHYLMNITSILYLGLFTYINIPYNGKKTCMESKIFPVVYTH